MKLTVGYQPMETDIFMREIIRRKDDIAEVYFSYAGMPNGRNPSDLSARLPAWQIREMQASDLARLSSEGISFNLLLNGNCYGATSLSRSFFSEICETVDEVGERYGLASVTTTSPEIARLIKRNFPSLEVRASVNMEIGTPEGVDYLADCFDGFYMARELNRELPRLSALSAHIRSLGKRPYILANSGCLRHCSARQYHDNLVAHEREIMRHDNAVRFRGICTDYFEGADDPSLYLSRLSFIRPEDLGLYEGLADAVKLATRVNASPARVLAAYADRHFSGNLLDLLEPNHAATLYPRVIENGALPKDFGAVSASCLHDCADCGYCRGAADLAIRRLWQDVTVDGGEKCQSN